MYQEYSMVTFEVIRLHCRRFHRSVHDLPSGYIWSYRRADEEKDEEGKEASPQRAGGGQALAHVLVQRRGHLQAHGGGQRGGVGGGARRAVHLPHRRAVTS